MTRNLTSILVPLQRKPETVPTLGDFIAGVYDACDESRARVIVWLAAKGKVVVFRRRKSPFALK